MPLDVSSSTSSPLNIWILCHAGLGLQGTLELKMERGDADDMIHTNHSSDSQRSDEEGDLKTHGDHSGGNR